MKKVMYRKGDRWATHLPYDCFEVREDGLYPISAYDCILFLSMVGVRTVGSDRGWTVAANV
jgi:hypothetical protein